MERRNTVQRNLVLEAVRELGNHATAEEIYSKITLTHPSVSKGTVYRNLNILSDAGEIKKIEISGAADCYDHVTGEHYHMRCQKCGRVFDIETKEMPDLTEKIVSGSGFEIQSYDVVFKGLCPECKIK